MKDRLQLSDSIETNDLEKTITFNITKNELFKITDNLKILNRKLKSTYKVNINRDPIVEENECIKQTSILVLAGPRTVFDITEIAFIRQFLDTGKSVLILASEGGEISLNTNINQLLEHYGIIINSDAVIRTQYCKYYLPKECFLNDYTSVTIFGYPENIENRSMGFMYPFGATLAVEKPSVVALTSGNCCYPSNRPLCAVYTNSSTAGRLIVLGSGYMLTDKYLEQEQNEKFCDRLFQFLSDDIQNINEIDGDEFDIWDYHMVPDIRLLAEKAQLCLVDSATISTDFTKLFNTKLYSLDTDLIPEIIQSYEEIQVKHQPLTLIVPKFEEATPPLQLAVFPPLFSELPPPPLELFDLEEELSGEETQLAQLTNRLLTNLSESHDDLEQYIMEATDILGIGQQDYSPNRQIFECAQIISSFKLSNMNIVNEGKSATTDSTSIEKAQEWLNNENEKESDIDSINISD